MILVTVVAIPRIEVQKWCIDNEFELIELDSGDDEDQGNHM